MVHLEQAKLFSRGLSLLMLAREDEKLPSTCVKVLMRSANGSARLRDSCDCYLKRQERRSPVLSSSTKLMGSLLFVQASRNRSMHRSSQPSLLLWMAWMAEDRLLSLVQQIDLTT